MSIAHLWIPGNMQSKTGRNEDFAFRAIEADRMIDQTKCIE